MFWIVLFAEQFEGFFGPFYGGVEVASFGVGGGEDVEHARGFVVGQLAGFRCYFDGSGAIAQFIGRRGRQYPGQISHANERVGVVRGKLGFLEWERLRVTAEVGIADSKIRRACERVGMIGTELRFPQRERFLVKFSGFTEAT